MARPNTSLSTLRPELGGGLEQFNLAADREGFIGMRVFPVFEAQKSAGTFPVIPAAELLRMQEDLSRNPDGGYKRDDIQFGEGNFVTKEQGCEEVVDENDANNFADYIDAEQVAADRAFDKVLRRHEYSVAQKCQDTGAIGNAAGTDWSNWNSGTPILDMEAAVEAFAEACGMYPTTAIVPRLAFRNARNCDEFLDRVKYSGHTDVKASKVTAAIMAEAFDIPEVLVPGGTRNLSNKGQALTFGRLWHADRVVLCRIANSNDLRQPCIGRTFHWGGDGSSAFGAMESYRDETVRGDIIRCRQQTQEKVMYALCARIVTGVNGGAA